jgi:hypothetical protein
MTPVLLCSCRTVSLPGMPANATSPEAIPPNVSVAVTVPVQGPPNVPEIGSRPGFPSSRISLGLTRREWPIA